MAAWRAKRALTWITGVICFVGSIGTAFTGYLSQSNFDSQWISTQAKDRLNSVDIGVALLFTALARIYEPNPATRLHAHDAVTKRETRSGAKQVISVIRSSAVVMTSRL